MIFYNSQTIVKHTIVLNHLFTFSVFLVLSPLDLPSSQQLQGFSSKNLSLFDRLIFALFLLLLLYMYEGIAIESLQLQHQALQVSTILFFIQILPFIQFLFLNFKLLNFPPSRFFQEVQARKSLAGGF